MAELHFNKNFEKDLKKLVEKNISDVEYKLGTTASETERNLAKALKDKGITPNMSSVRKMAQEHHKNQ